MLRELRLSPACSLDIAFANTAMREMAHRTFSATLVNAFLRRLSRLPAQSFTKGECDWLTSGEFSRAATWRERRSEAQRGLPAQGGTPRETPIACSKIFSAGENAPAAENSIIGVDAARGEERGTRPSRRWAR